MFIAPALVTAGLLTAVSPPARAQGVPTFDVRPSCRGGSDGRAALESCLRSEADARRRLTETWSQYTPASRRECVGEVTRESPSYVEILTCLEMAKAAKSLPKENMDLGAPATIEK
jgi:hypothetical protein